MRTVCISQLFHENYSVRFLNCLRQFWRKEQEFSCLNSPKKEDIFIFLDGCKARLTLRSGEVLEANSGALIYTPIGSEYHIRFYDFQEEYSGTIAVNFRLYDNDNAPFILSSTPLVFQENLTVKMLMSQAERLSISPFSPPVKFNVVLYELLCELGAHENARQTKCLPMITKGLEYLFENLHKEISIRELASVCGISEAYFRKLFRQEFSTSPAEYREGLRIERACQYLRFGEENVNEIAESLGYADSAYFIKRFKRKMGVTPLSYRKSHK